MPHFSFVFGPGDDWDFFKWPQFSSFPGNVTKSGTSKDQIVAGIALAVLTFPSFPHPWKLSLRDPHPVPNPKLDFDAEAWYTTNFSMRPLIRIAILRLTLTPTPIGGV